MIKNIVILLFFFEFVIIKYKVIIMNIYGKSLEDLEKYFTDIVKRSLKLFRYMIGFIRKELILLMR